MEKKFRTPANRDQLMLLPRSIDEFVLADDAVRYVDAFVDELDLSVIEAGYSEMGRPGFSPSVMVKILLYGKMRGIRSSRELARAVRENVRFMFVSSGERPDFRTISLFRKRFSRELAGLLRQTIDVGLKSGMIQLDHVVVDGTVLQAYASRKSFRSKKQLRKLERTLERSFKADGAVDDREDETHGDDDGDGKLPPDMTDRRRLREHVKRALAEVEAVDEQLKEKGREVEWISLSDPESRLMKYQGGRRPGYNGQVAVDAESRMVVGGYATNAVSDNGELPDLLADIEANTGENPKTLSADKGYSLKAGLADLQERGIDGYIPQREEKSGYFKQEDFRYEEQSDTYRCPNNRVLRYRGGAKHKRKAWRTYKSDDCRGCPMRPQCVRVGSVRRTLHISIYSGLYYEMREKMRTERGRRMAVIRAATVETVFGHIKANRKLGQCLVRGREMMDALWKFELAAYNIERIVARRMALDSVS